MNGAMMRRTVRDSRILIARLGPKEAGFVNKTLFLRSFLIKRT